jgi:hypothetical protein
MQKTANVQPAVVPVVRVLRLKRRRTNVPWIYSLYHADPKPRRRRARELEELEEWLEAEGLMALGGDWDGCADWCGDWNGGSDGNREG